MVKQCCPEKLTGTRLPESNSKLLSASLQKVIDLLLRLDRRCNVLVSSLVGLDEMVAVDRGRNGGGWHAGEHKLEQGHLGRGILHRHSVYRNKRLFDSNEKYFRVI